MIFAAVLVLGLLSVFAVELGDTQAKSRRDVVTRIKANASLRRIPVVVLATSSDEQDVRRTYELGVSSFITKPVTFAGLVETMRGWTRYWFEMAELPNGAVA